VFGACVPDFEPDPDPDPCELGARAAGQDDGSCNPCPDGLTRCGPACVDTKWSEDHCGACFAPNPDGLFCCNGTLCPRGMPCSNGECTCGSFNWCYHRLLGHNVCFSGDCSLLA
jgi:hypothetical protein